MTHYIRDNKNRGTLYDFLKHNINKDSKLSFVSAYFTVYAYEGLKNELNNIDSLRFLFGEPSFARSNNLEQSRQFEMQQREKSLAGLNVEMVLKNRMNQSAIAKECAHWIREKVEVRSLKKPDFLHGKAYIIENNAGSVSTVGSSNFTSGGLGIKKVPNMELNLISESYSTTKELKLWFDEIWNDSDLVEDVKAEVLNHLETIYKENSPEFIYFFTLFNVFKKFLEEISETDIEESKIGIKETVIWNKLYNFQRDGVVGAINKLEKYGGCIIADSVGLGKTFEALAVIKYYELKNYKALVLAPKKLRENWITYRLTDRRNILEKDRFHYDVLNHTDLTREKGKSGDISLDTVNWGNYDLVVIDESHNFRNNPARRDRATRYSKLMNDIIKSGVKTKVLMLSATPVNNGMRDLKNQVEFITEGNDNALRDSVGLTSIDSVLRKAQSDFNKWSELPDDERTVERLLNVLSYDYFTLLDSLTIARSRKHIEKYYCTKEIGKFPTRLKPENIKKGIDTEGDAFDFKVINKEIKRLKLAIYSPLGYVKLNKREEYSRKYDIQVSTGTIFTQLDRENSLKSLIRINMLKRLESSVNSFGITTQRIIDRIEKLLFDIDHMNHNPELRIDDLDIDDEEFRDDLVGDKIKILLQDLDKARLRQDLIHDKRILEELMKMCHQVNPERDLKLVSLKKYIQNKIEKPINEGNKKLIIFTAFADTAKYLYDNIAFWAKDKFTINSALVVGSDENKTTLRNISKDLNSILTNFSPIAKERDKTNGVTQGEIDILIATDCVSEGQNLQDCDCVVNYDIHWNPVRIIQRFGRIDRLGSKNDKIQLVNFWPNLELEEYINLEKRVKDKMVLLDISATGEENIIGKDDQSKMRDLEYRKKQLEKLKNQVVDLEDMSGGVSLTDFTLNDFKIDLMDFIRNNRSTLEKTSTGIYSLVPRDVNNVNVELPQGVIFCVKATSGKTNDTYPLHPYYLIYINQDQTVHYHNTSIKKILDIYRGLCLGQRDIFEELVIKFQHETQGCSQMDEYTELLKLAVKDIGKVEQQKSIKTLFSPGKTKLNKETGQGIKGFELISFLVIK